ncbi:MAG: alkaline phosphatase family protein [Chloroflexota bacterium]
MSASIAQTLEAKIRTNRIIQTTASWDEEIIFPYYDGLSLPNITQSIAQILGAPFSPALPLQDEVWQADVPQAKRVVLFLMDGMGYKHLRMLMADDSELAQAVADLSGGRDIVPLTSVAPSTTVVALTSLWTGKPPSATAITGTAMFLKEVSLLANMLSMAPIHGRLKGDILADWGAAPENLVQAQGLGEHLSANDIESYVVSNKMYKGVGLSRILNRGTTHYVPILSYSDALIRFRNTLRETRGKHGYIWMYWSGVDSSAHNYGAHSEETNAEIKRQILALRDTLQDEAIRDGQTLLLLLADHGHYDSVTPITFGDDEIMKDALQMSISGDERHGYAYLQNGTVDAIKAHIDATYAETLTYLDTQEAINAGYFGTEVAPALRYRTGDLILLPRLGHIISDPILGTIPMISRHAGLSDWEMLVPFMWQIL